MQDRPVLVTGATGYVGGRLVPLLLDRGYRVRAVGRSLDKLRCRPWGGHENLEIFQADVHDVEAFTRACEGCGVAYYLVHSMHPRHRDFSTADRMAACNMVRASNAAGLSRIIYLSGLTPSDPRLSEHLRSRAEVAEILSLGATPVTVLRAAMILGSGSASFELMRYLADRLPVMVTPSWVRTEAQPISIRNVLGYLVGCLEKEETAGRTFDIGGNCIETYEGLFRIYCEEAGLKRRIIIPVPMLSPYLSSLWSGLVTPIPTSLARPLIMGLRNRVVCSENSIRDIIPQDLMDCRAAIRKALERIEQQKVETCWHDAGELSPPEWVACGDAPYSGGTVLRCGYRILLGASPERIWPAVAAIGGEQGWYFANFLWRFRGLLDRIFGGVGLRRGRRSPTEIRVGDALDFWRVLDIEEHRRLLLLAEMKLPGEALLDLKLEPVSDGRTSLVMLGKFLPRGVAGLLYWYGVYPLHHLVFAGTLKNIALATGADILSPAMRFTPIRESVCRPRRSERA